MENLTERELQETIVHLERLLEVTKANLRRKQQSKLVNRYNENVPLSAYNTTPFHKITDTRVAFIINHLWESDSIRQIRKQDIAKLIQVDYSSINTLTKAQTSMTFKQIINTVTLYRTYMLILTTHYSLTDIGMELGFSDSSSELSRFTNGQTGKKTSEIASDLEIVKNLIDFGLLKKS